MRESNPDRLGNSPGELIDYHVALYHSSLRRDVRNLDHYTEFLASRRLVSLTAMDRLRREFIAFADLLETHLAGQEVWLFPRIRGHDSERLTLDQHDCSTDDLEDALDELTATNTELLGRIDQIGNFLSGPYWVGKGPLVKRLMEKLYELRRGIRVYARLETDTVVPRLQRFVRERCAATAGE